eukprot:TRINITY_DN112569_c0_g1_i1.p1 TRINITY_DN112569_c0_g1~~TRINITY_DN112569_c0_g1_i1.p1  ORF type:complete len:161 (-),score=4.73 TRINITY_DN112569_c0_g1_i1:114-596(-)
MTSAISKSASAATLKGSVYGRQGSPARRWREPAFGCSSPRFAPDSYMLKARPTAGMIHAGPTRLGPGGYETHITKAAIRQDESRKRPQSTDATRVTGAKAVVEQPAFGSRPPSGTSTPGRFVANASFRSGTPRNWRSTALSGNDLDLSLLRGALHSGYQR